ncbi:universal stress protein A-like protein [Spinacia oleracea]|uniref:Universal stress protein A-like protein n=1 Tax=Spinacia oleracea TaxID=3562 RepID=A0A9R0J0M2_SPIOL|nr:universal stress protein A-like protein [Spinacia oleracea]
MEQTITPAREVVVGSGADSGRVVQQEEQAPLVVGRGITTEEQKMKVMVALDDSDGSFYSLNWALTNLLKPKSIAPNNNTSTPNEEEGCMVYLVHVQHPFTNYVYPAGAGLHTASFAASSVVESVKKAQAEISATILERAISICKQNMVRAETLIFEGDPKDEICKAIEQIHVDMLVIGSRGLGGIKRAFLGSVSDYCAHHASCPVLIVKPPKNIIK